MENIFDGVKLTQCFNFISNAGNEIDALSNILNNQICKAIDKTSFKLVSNRPMYSSKNDNSGWILTDCSYSLSLKSKHKKNTDKYLGFQISLLGDGIGFSEKSEPLLHVFFWGSKVDFNEGNYMCIPYAASSEDDPWTLIHEGRLINWGDLGGWVFSIRLTTLNSAQDLEQHIVSPMVELLSGKQPEEAFAGSHPGLVTYQIVEDGMLIIKED